MTTLVNIRCRELALSISREQCGAQVTRPHAPAVCRTCPVGLAHARGEAPTCWPDGERIEERVHVVDGPVSDRAVALKPKPAPFSSRHRPRKRKQRDEVPATRGPDRQLPTGGSGRTWLYEGRYLTPRELAELPEARVSAKKIGARLDLGWSIERALSQPLGWSRRKAA